MFHQKVILFSQTSNIFSNTQSPRPVMLIWRKNMWNLLLAVNSRMRSKKYRGYPWAGEILLGLPQVSAWPLERLLAMSRN